MLTDEAALIRYSHQNTLAYHEQTVDDFELELQRSIDDLDKERADLHKSLETLMQPRNPNLSTRPSLLSKARYALTRPRGTLKKALTDNIEAFDMEMSRIKTRLTRVKSRRQEVAAELAGLKASLCPQPYLPPEIWSTIFNFCLPDDGAYVSLHPTSMPLVLGKVSRRWRAIATSTPSLWNSLAISCNWRKRPNCLLLQEWLQRSGCLPLSIDISLPHCSPHRRPSHNDLAFLQILLGCSERWRRLRLNVADSFLLHIILTSCIPLLHSLEFSSNCAIRNLHISNTSAPNLRAISLLTAPLDPAPLSLPWIQLTRLSSRCWADTDSHLEVLRRCPNLEYARLHILQAHGSSPFGSPLRMEKLRTFEAIALTGSAMGIILERLELPSLAELLLTVPEESPEYGTSRCPIDAVESLLERSSAKGAAICLEGFSLS